MSNRNSSQSTYIYCVHGMHRGKKRKNEMLNIFKKVARMIQMARLESELRNMSDRTLADIGISRAEIPDVVRAVFALNAEQPAVAAANSNTNSNSSLAA